jgi:hypothetical protein
VAAAVATTVAAIAAVATMTTPVATMSAVAAISAVATAVATPVATTVAAVTTVTAVAAVATIATMTCLGLLFSAAQQGQSNDREEDRDTKSKKTIHPKSLLVKVPYVRPNTVCRHFTSTPDCDGWQNRGSYYDPQVSRTHASGFAALCKALPVA